MYLSIFLFLLIKTYVYFLSIVIYIIKIFVKYYFFSLIYIKIVKFKILFKNYKIKFFSIFKKKNTQMSRSLQKLSPETDFDLQTPILRSWYPLWQLKTIRGRPVFLNRELRLQSSISKIFLVRQTNDYLFID